MRAVTIKKEYEVGDRFGLFFASDLHIDSNGHDAKLMKREFDEAKRLNCRIIIAGDIFDFLMNGDNKRYSPSKSKYGPVDGHINYSIDNAFESLKDYAKNIDVMMLGNHESSVIKFHSFDPVAVLINRLNRECGANIHYLAYNGYIRYAYRYKNGNASRSYDIKICHGIGGNSPVTKGTISQARTLNMHDADLYVSGHSHQALVLPSENRTYLDQYGNIRIKERKVLVTGCYVKPFHQSSLTSSGGANPYNVQYADLMSSLQSTGGAMVEHEFLSKDDMITRIIV
jgi:hypothetical protein